MRNGEATILVPRRPSLPQSANGPLNGLERWLQLTSGDQQHLFLNTEGIANILR